MYKTGQNKKSPVPIAREGAGYNFKIYGEL